MNIEYSNNLKLVGKIKKDIFSQLITGIYDKTYEINKLYGKLNIEHCTNCKNTKKRDCTKCTSQKYDVCTKYDDGAVLISDRIEKVSIKKLLSKKEILVYLYYHFCNVSNKGEIPVISERDMAKTINCSITTIYNVNNTLRNLSLIEFERIGKGLISVSINNYEKTFENQIVRRINENNKKLKVDNGFITLTLNWFKELINASNTTNTLRLALYKTIKFDSDKVRNLNKKNYKKKIFFRDYKKVLTGKLCNKEILALINKIDNLFIDEVDMNVVNNYSMKDDFIAKKVMDRYKKHCSKQFIKLLGKLSQNNKDDLLSLSVQYGVTTIINKLNKLIENGETKESLKDDLGLIVTLIKDEIEDLLASKVKNSIFNREESFIM